jgi:hypothetical protein
MQGKVGVFRRTTVNSSFTDIPPPGASNCGGSSVSTSTAWGICDPRTSFCTLAQLDTVSTTQSRRKMVFITGNAAYVAKHCGMSGQFGFEGVTYSWILRISVSPISRENNHDHPAHCAVAGPVGRQTNPTPLKSRHRQKVTNRLRPGFKRFAQSFPT